MFEHSASSIVAALAVVVLAAAMAAIAGIISI
jgi:hypothetical protein